MPQSLLILCKGLPSEQRQVPHFFLSVKTRSVHKLHIYIIFLLSVRSRLFFFQLKRCREAAYTWVQNTFWIIHIGVQTALCQLLPDQWCQWQPEHKNVSEKISEVILQCGFYNRVGCLIGHYSYQLHSFEKFACMNRSFQGKDVSLLICRNKILLLETALKTVHLLSMHTVLCAFTPSAMFLATRIILQNQSKQRKEASTLLQVTLKLA